MEITTIPIRYIHALLGAAKHRGVDGEKLLRKADISAELLGNNKARVPAAQYVQFSQSLTEALQDEYLGFMNTPCKPGTFEMMCYACISCPNLQQFLERGIKFYGLVTDSVDLSVHIEGEEAQYVLNTGHGTVDPENFLPFIMLSIVHRLSSWVIDQPLILQSVSFTHPRPDSVDEYHFLFKAPVKFDQAANSLNFSSNYLSMPNRQNEQSLETFLESPPRRLMGISSSENSWVIKIKRQIKENMNADFPEFDSIAERLNLTTATLRRRLREEGSSYQQIKDDIRRDGAIYNLGKGNLSIEQVAERAGFSEPTSFFRAFKRWTGVTPRAYISKKEPVT